MTLHFTFEFSDSDFEDKGWERPLTNFRFTVELPFTLDSEEYEDWYDECLIDQASELEEYGVHDFTASGLPNGTWAEFGYHSYEVRQDKWEELMQKWHEWFEVQGFNPGEIEIIPTNEG